MNSGSCTTTSAGATPANMEEMKTSVEHYYDKKEAVFGYKKDNYLPDTAKWWANGNIICNQHTSLDDKNKQDAAEAGTGEAEAFTQWWGDSFLLQIKDMIAETCRCREVSLGQGVLCILGCIPGIVDERGVM